jgi:hypothetical protein
MKINELFEIHSAKSQSIDTYEKGGIPFITSSEINNGVIGFVEPFPGDKIFDKKTICISGLGFATLQTSKYLPKGNGGDSATILIPKMPMSINELLFYTAQFNLINKWRFSFGRKCNMKRVERLSFSMKYKHTVNYDIINRNIKHKLLKKIEDIDIS